MTVWLTVLVGVFLAVVVADRVVAVVATRLASRHLLASAGLVTVVSHLRVQVRGAPFLTQALRGRYRSVYVTGRGLRIGPITDGRLRGVLRGARVPLRSVLAGAVHEVPAARLDASVVVPYAQLPALTRIDGLVVVPDGDYLAVTAPMPVPGVGSLVRVAGRGELHVVDGQVRLAMSGLRVAGVALPGVVVGQLSRALGGTIAIPPLPYGLAIVDVRVGADGLVVRCTAEHPVLRPVEPAAVPVADAGPPAVPMEAG
ncbi:MAG TPA: DUF2993 domain-containing protein [Jatrophihabitantaceae bacterium]|jgi:hypothetical protein